MSCNWRALHLRGMLKCVRVSMYVLHSDQNFVRKVRTIWLICNVHRLFEHTDLVLRLELG